MVSPDLAGRDGVPSRRLGSLEPMSSEIDSTGLTSWTGWDVRGGVDVDSVAAAFARTAPSDADGEERYELLAVAGRGFRPPRFLTVADRPGSPDDEQDRGERGDRADYQGLRQTWSLWYRRVASTGGSTPRR